MSLYVFFSVFCIAGVGFAVPMGRNLTIREHFVYPTERTNGGIAGRIIGGQEATPHAYPYQVGLYCRGAFNTNFCGGSLVSSNYVLTAAHCVEDILTIDLIFGAHQIEEEEDTQVRQTSAEFMLHPDWDRNQLLNDVALVRLPTPVEETDYIKIISITTGTETYAGDLGVIAGWGVIRNGQTGVTPTLRYAVGDILTNTACKDIDPYSNVIQPTHLCLSGVFNNANIGTCNGDSGGPLTVDGIQVGLVSFGYTDCEAGKPSVFSRLTEYVDWIRDNSDVNI